MLSTKKPHEHRRPRRRGRQHRGHRAALERLRGRRTAIEPLAAGVVNEGEVQDLDALSDALRSLFTRNKLSKDVRLGLANQRVVVRTLRLPLIEDPDEIDAAVHFQAEDELGMPLEQAVLDHEVVARGGGPQEGRTMDVLTVAARRDMVGSCLKPCARQAFAPPASTLPPSGSSAPLSAEANPPGGAESDATTLYCYLGDVTNLAVARGSGCLFTRIAPSASPASSRASPRARTCRSRTLGTACSRSGWRSRSSRSTRNELAAAVRKSLDEGVLSSSTNSASRSSSTAPRKAPRRSSA